MIDRRADRYRVSRTQSVAKFRSLAEPYLGRDEALHNLMLGILSTLDEVPNAYSDQRPYLAAVRDGGDVVGVCMMTPPHNAISSKVDEREALDALVTDLADATQGDPAGQADAHSPEGRAMDARIAVPGVIGAVPYAEQFAARWRAYTGRGMRRGMRQGIYQLQTVTPPTGTRGRARLATDDDRSLLLRWFEAFTKELSHGSVGESVTLEVDRRLRQESAGYYIWEVEHGRVSFAGFGGFTPKGARIGPVYTPVELRGRGYASAVTAHASQALLNAGRTFCFLYTDLANPTSNGIYRRIGYEMMGESEEWRVIDEI
jgi:ribosomal protein S18 acetylase RimI-like enzyme